jgi:SPP1 gp7 family putative phage head morphogenesis protein
MSRVPPRLRRLAAEQARSRRPAESAALRAARTRGLLARAAALAAWDAAADPAAVVVAIGLALAPLAADLAGAMASAHAAGVAHVRAGLPSPTPSPLPSPAGRRLALARRTAGLPAVVARYLPAATRAVSDAAAAVVRAVASAAGKAVSAGRDVAGAIRRAFGAAGVTVGGAAGNVLATLAGTLAGRAFDDGLAEAAVAGRAWGYAWLTQRDDRVRPNHAAMDGVRRPANDPVWLKWRVPAGFSCRCVRVVIAAGDPLAKPTDVPNVSPDAGF